jgi:hypothetical protein
VTGQLPPDQPRKRRMARFNHVLAMATSLLLLGLLLTGGIIGIWGLVRMLRRLF